jgi:hypothetical protein
MNAPLPDPFYYLANFQRVLEWLGDRYADLLSEAERGFIDSFAELPRLSRALLVRMLMRKGELFRASKLAYAEIGCPRRAAAPLLGHGWLDDAPALSLEQLFGVLRKAEIAAAFGDCLERAQLLNKTQLLACLRERFADESRPLRGWHAATDECVYRVLMVELSERLRLMFFGNLRQGWSEFVLAELGIHRYEKVEFSAASRAFRRREDIDDYLRLQRCRERFEQGEALAEVVASLPARLENPWIEARRGKLMLRIGQQHERLGELPQALHLYAACTHAGARLRMIRVLERSERIDQALQLAARAAGQPESEAERQQLLRSLPRLRRKAGLPPSARRQPLALQRLDLQLPPGLPGSVELVVRDHLTRPEAPVHYVENTLINALFGLLCWPALFAALPGAFFHPFHAAPADLLDTGFVRRRQALFDGCLALLDGDGYRQRIRSTFAAKYGLQSPFVAWGLLDEALLDQALQCIPAEHLKKCFERILLDIGANRSGLPDLIQFWPGERRYRMIEVKGPGDRLQDNQVRWLDYCQAHGLPVAVCHVQWPG